VRKRIAMHVFDLRNAHSERRLLRRGCDGMPASRTVVRH